MKLLKRVVAALVSLAMLAATAIPAVAEDGGDLNFYGVKTYADGLPVYLL